MSDVIKAYPNVSPDEVIGAAYGLLTLRDNHGNTYREGVLGCAGGAIHRLNFGADSDLIKRIDFHEQLDFFRNQGEIKMLFGLESPLQSTCRGLEAAKHHQSKPNPRHR